MDRALPSLWLDWLWRLLWVAAVVIGVAFLPPDDGGRRTPQLQRSLLEGLAGAWTGALGERLEADGVATGPTFLELMGSFLSGSETLPEGPAHRLVLRLGEVQDRSGLTPGVTRERALEILGAVDGLELVEGADASIPTVDLEIVGTGLDLVARVPTPRDLPLRAAAGAELDGRPIAAADLGWERREHRPSRYSLIPPLVAILCALLTRRAVLSLLLGIIAGAAVMASARFSEAFLGGLGAWGGDVYGLFESQVTDLFRLSIIFFVLFLVGMVGVMTRLGGTQGLVELLTRYSRGVRSTRVVTALMGFLVFFDDYSNSVIVGSSMRPITDRMRISREKLAYLIDSTAAPVAGIAIFSTWIGYEVGQYAAALEVRDAELAGQAYGIFIATIPLRFYCIFTLLFVLANTLLSRDYGPMRRAEERAALEGKLVADDAQPLTSREFTELRIEDGMVPRARNAVVPLAVVLGVMLLGFAFVGEGIPKLSRWWSGEQDSGFVEFVADILGSDYIMQVTVVAAALGSLVAVAMAVAGGLGLRRAIHAWLIGFKSIALAVLILFSAWAIAGSCTELHTGDYLSALLADTVPLVWLPVGVFVLACVVAFATGTSWGTMAILLPISIPIVYDAEAWSGAGLGPVTLLALGAVLEGSIFGDHCSPISDTTVLASVSAGSDHIDHVRTQIPYALTTMAIAIVVGYIPVARGWYSPTVAIGLGAVVCVTVLLVLGRTISEPPPGTTAAPGAADRDRQPALS